MGATCLTILGLTGKKTIGLFMAERSAVSSSRLTKKRLQTYNLLAILLILLYFALKRMYNLPTFSDKAQRPLFTNHYFSSDVLTLKFMPSRNGQFNFIPPVQVGRCMTITALTYKRHCKRLSLSVVLIILIQCAVPCQAQI